ncbi:MAG: endonuclease/exonuclease/phosphatase family protein [Flavobacteriaceae bacterium]
MIFNSASDLKVLSYNIRYNNPKDGKNQWEFRKETILKQLLKSEYDLIGMQEVVYDQLNYLASGLSEYSYVGVGREDGKQKGEFSPIFYRKTSLKLLESNTFWLSKTPDQISVGWDAALERICTYAQFEHLSSGKQFWIFNTHFDHIGKLARAQSAQLILNKIEALNTQKVPIILTGDFNLTPETKPIQILQAQLVDIQNKLPQTAPNYGTFTGFEISPRSQRRIDYIFSKGFSKAVGNHLLIKTPKGLWASDHHPVEGVLNF